MTWQPVPMSRWGKDHWSALAYVESRIVDYRGVLGIPHLRGHQSDQYPTRLANGELLEGHSDFDCLADMLHHRLLTIDLDDEIAGPNYDRRPYRRMLRLMLERRIVWRLTPLGTELALALRVHKQQEGATWSNFRAPASAAFRARLRTAMAAEPAETGAR